MKSKHELNPKAINKLNTGDDKNNNRNAVGMHNKSVTSKLEEITFT